MKWFVVAILIVITGLLLRLEWLVLAMYLLLGVLLVSRYLAREWTNKIGAVRSCGVTTAQIGDRVKIATKVTNHGKWRVPWMILEEALPKDAMQSPPRIRVKGQSVFITGLDGGKTRTIRYEIECLKRGYHQFGPLLIESGDLFGLHRRYRIVSMPVYVLVYPEVVALKGYDIASRKPVGEIRMTHRLFEDPTRISGVRPYQPGDPLNRIHWPAFAQTGALHSKIFEPSCVAGATLLLDFHERSFSDRDPAWMEDLLITTAASLANAVYELGQQIGLMSNGRDAAERIRNEGWQAAWSTRADAVERFGKRATNERLQPIVMRPRRGPEQLQRIHETLARLEHTDGFRFDEMIYELASRIPRDASVVALLVDVTEETARALGQLRRSGYSVTAVVVSADAAEFRDWAEPASWAGWLLREGIEFRPVSTREQLAELQPEEFMSFAR